MTTAHDFPIPPWTQGDRMRKSLEAAGFSVKEAAMRFGVARNTISNWIHDNTKPTPTELEVWADWTSVPLQWIKTGDGQPGPDGGNPVTHRFAADFNADSLRNRHLSHVGRSISPKRLVAAA